LNENINLIPNSPITDDIYLSEGTLSAAEFSAFGYILDNNVNIDIVLSCTFLQILPAEQNLLKD